MSLNLLPNKNSNVGKFKETPSKSSTTSKESTKNKQPSLNDSKTEQPNETSSLRVFENLETTSRNTISSTDYKLYQKLTWDNQFYEGTVLLNNLHGHGFYLTQKNSQKIFYDCLFYVNNLEGYGQTFYENGTHFQGLFKQNKRYGPGVLSYPDGRQDVGVWDGFTILRLATLIEKEVVVPTLANTSVGKAKLLRYRNLVPLARGVQHFGKEVLSSLGANDEVQEDMDTLLNIHIRNPNSLFFNRRFFDEHFFRHPEGVIEVQLEEDEVLADESLEEEAELLFEENIEHRINHLRTKINEVSESMERFVAIKESLLEKISFCHQCCVSEAPREGIDGSKEIIVHEENPPTSKGMDQEMVLDDTSINTADFVLIRHPDDINTPDTKSATSFENKIMDYCVCGEAEDITDLQYLEGQLSNIEKQEIFYRNIRDNLRQKLDREEDGKKDVIKPKTKKILVTEICAWNNEESLAQIQKHCFKHRNSEKMVNFSVLNLVYGKRKEFGAPGQHEEKCRKFLIACAKGKKGFVKECLLRRDVNVNLTDAKGNSGVFFAASNNQLEIISILTNFGAKLDQINDEGLTALNLCLLKYLAVKNKCSDWEMAFLAESEVLDYLQIPKWYKVRSFFSLSSKSSKDSTSQSFESDCPNSRIIELFQRMSVLQQRKLSIKNHQKDTYVFNLSYKSDSNKSNHQEILNDDEDQVLNELKSIQLTVMTLLEYGSDPNISEVPYPPLILSIFTENADLVIQILKSKADVNKLVTNDALSCLHIVASLGNSENHVAICKVLLEHHCDPNLKTLPGHWEEQKVCLTGQIPLNFEIEDTGKNALHLLCMRKDFEDDSCNYFSELSKVLLDFGIDANEKYLGQTALSMAVIAGNTELVKFLIRSNVFDPYRVLPYGLGNIMTLYTLKRFDNILPVDKCKDMLMALFDLDVNFLNEVGDFENVIAFIDEGDSVFQNISKNEKTTKKGQKVEKKPKKGGLYEFIKDLARNLIIKYIQMISVDILYDLAEEEILESKEQAVILAEFLTPTIALANLENLLHNEIIDEDRFDLNICKIVLDFVNLHKKAIKAKKAKATKGKLKKEGSKTSTEETMDDLIEKANFKKELIVLPQTKSFVVKPGLDDISKYKVCFHCLKRQNKELKACPRCQLIYFCSNSCNKLNIKLKSQHTCNILFYDVQNMQIQDTDDKKVFFVEAQMIKNNCLRRLYKKREAKLLKEEEKLLEMWRADIYGTKFLSFKGMTSQYSNNRKGISWNFHGIKNIMERNFQKNPADFDAYSLEALRSKLSTRGECLKRRGSKDMEIRSRSRSKVRTSSVGNELMQKLNTVVDEQKEKEIKKNDCPCSERAVRESRRMKPILSPESRKKHRKEHMEHQIRELKTQLDTSHIPGKFEKLNLDYAVQEIPPVVKKLRKIPEKYRKFVESLATYFPDIDLSFWLLPYVCCSEGQLYYRFCDSDFFRQSYSFL